MILEVSDRDITEESGTNVAHIVGDVAHPRARKCVSRTRGQKLGEEGDLAKTRR